MTVAYDLGGGISTDLTKHINVAFEYVYSSLGHISPSTNYTTEQFIVNAPAFSMASQSVLMRVSWTLDGVNAAPVSQHATQSRNVRYVSTAKQVNSARNFSAVTKATNASKVSHAKNARNIRHASKIRNPASTYPETHNTWL